MSVFSRIKRGRQAAKEHNAKQAELQKKEEEKTPYRHIPSHAAIDALSGGPATWRETDRPKILEQNRRRSAMTANGVGMGSGMMTPVHVGMPRVNSALSHVSYPSLYASPLVQVPRTYSYSSMQHPGWNNHGGEVVYSHVGPGGGSVKGKEVERVMVDSGRASRSSSKATSPVGSSNNSTSSQDDLEMKPAKPARHADPSPSVSATTSGAATPTGNSRSAGEIDYFHRLHPSHSRRISDTPSTSSQHRGSYVSQRQGGPRVMSLPSSGIPPVPALPQLQFGSPLSHYTSSHSGSTPSTTPRASAVLSSVDSYSDPASSKPSRASKASSSPVRMPLPEEVAGPISSVDLEPSPPVGVAVTTPTLIHKNKRISKATRFTELETIPSHIPAPKIDIPVEEPVKETIRPTVTQPAPVPLPTEFDESSLPASRPDPPATKKPAKLTKSAGGSKLVKKNRWSMKSGKSTAVAV